MPRSATHKEDLPVTTTSSPAPEGALAGGARRRRQKKRSQRQQQRSQRKRSQRRSQRSQCDGGSQQCVQGGGGRKTKRKRAAGGAKRQAPAWMKIKAQLFKRIKAAHPDHSFAKVQKVIGELTSEEGFVKGQGGYQEALSAALAKYH